MFIVAIAILAWCFRYDTHCNAPNTCIAYDRLTGDWVFPKALASNTANEKLVKQLIAEKNKNFDYKKALLHGYSYEEIVSELRGKNE